MYRTTGEYRRLRVTTAHRPLSAWWWTAAKPPPHGNGPVHALDMALRKALNVFYPCLSQVRLTDYKVRVLTGEEATASKVRVLIESTDGEHLWTTVGVGTDVVAASWEALCDSLEYMLYRRKGE